MNEQAGNRIAASAKWLDWSRKNIGGSPERVEAAADAAVAALRRSSTVDEAVRAAREAARAWDRRYASSPPRDESAGFRRPAALDIPSVFRGQSIRGFATKVKSGQQLSSGGSIQTLNFGLDLGAGMQPVRVQMRGLILDGEISNGDVIEVPIRSESSSGFVQTDAAFNHSIGEYVRMHRGIQGSLRVSEAQIGRRWTRVQIVVAAIIVIVFLAFSAFIIFKIANFDNDFNERVEQQTVDFCEDVREMGIEPLPPDCR